MFNTKHKITDHRKMFVKCVSCGHELKREVGYILLSSEPRPFYIFEDDDGDLCPVCKCNALYVPSEVELQREKKKEEIKTKDLELPFKNRDGLRVVKIQGNKYALGNWNGRYFPGCKAIIEDENGFSFLTDENDKIVKFKISPVLDCSKRIIAYELI